MIRIALQSIDKNLMLHSSLLIMSWASRVSVLMTESLWTLPWESDSPPSNGSWPPFLGVSRLKVTAFLASANLSQPGESTKWDLRSLSDCITQ
jgi:hypothetical protein